MKVKLKLYKETEADFIQVSLCFSLRNLPFLRIIGIPDSDKLSFPLPSFP
jgi:hypothetical protein